jgi:hypothetical protein
MVVEELRPKSCGNPKARSGKETYDSHNSITY